MTQRIRRIAAGTGFALLLALAAGCGSVQTHGGPASLPVGNPHPGYCPVMGDKLDVQLATEDPDLHVDYEGKRYLLCCRMCKPKFEKEPERWIESPAEPEE